MTFDNTFVFTPEMIAILAVLFALLGGAQAYWGGYLCILTSHKWDLDPPWSGKELRHRPQCSRCGFEPVEIGITGSHEGDHRV